MPNALVEKVSKTCKMPIERVERLWDKAKQVAKEKGLSESDKGEFYKYVVGIFKHMITKKCTRKLEWTFPDRWVSDSGSIDGLKISVRLTDRLNTEYSPEWAEFESKNNITYPAKLNDFGFLGTSSSEYNSHTAFCSSDFSIGQSNPNEVINLADTDVKKTHEIKMPSVTGDSQAIPIDASFWLPLAAPYYNISKNLNDYLLFPVPGLITELPNSNGDSCSLSELLEFNTKLAMPAFKSFKGRPVHFEHQSSDMTQAKGVILDVHLRPLKNFNGKHAKMIELLAIDKTKDRDLCRKLEDGKLNTFSVGMYYTSFSCSVCGNEVSPNSGTPCAHTHLKCRTYQDPSTGQLVYRHCHNIFGFETSVVADPAYVSAIGTMLTR